MEITDQVPIEYETYALRRLFWQESGQRYDEMGHGEVMDAILFRRLEKAHPYRFERAKKEQRRN